MSRAPRNVIVTGGTGALGSAVVAAFLEAGDRVVVPWIEAAEAEQLAGSPAAAAAGRRLELLEADVTETHGAERVAAKGGAAAALVNGVGGFSGGAPVHETPLEDWDRMYRLNLRSAVAMSRAVVPGMRERGRGVVVNVASRAARERPAGLAAYAASKAGVVVLTETLQRELGGSGVRVVALLPSTIDTPANRAAMPDEDFASWTPPVQIARLIRWLASDAAEAVRGALIAV